MLFTGILVNRAEGSASGPSFSKSGVTTRSTWYTRVNFSSGNQWSPILTFKQWRHRQAVGSPLAGPLTCNVAAPGLMLGSTQSLAVKIFPCPPWSQQIPDGNNLAPSEGLRASWAHLWTDLVEAHASTVWKLDPSGCFHMPEKSDIIRLKSTTVL